MPRLSSNDRSAVWVHGLWALVTVAAFAGGYLASWTPEPSPQKEVSMVNPSLRAGDEMGRPVENLTQVAAAFPKAPGAGTVPPSADGAEVAALEPGPGILPEPAATAVLETTDDTLPPRGTELTPDQAHRLLSGTVWFQPGGIPSSKVPVTAETSLAAGQHLQVKWGEQWWAGTIMGFEPDGRVRIHYFGWADSWDEAKGREELQIDDSATLRAVDTVYRRRK